MGQRIEHSIRIMAPREAVWDVIQNCARRPEWDARVVDVTLLTPPPQQRGSRVRLTYRWLLARSWLELEYIVWNPPERSAVRAERLSPGNLFSSLSGSWHFTDNGDGTTGWTTVLNVRLRGGLVAPLLERIFVRGSLARLTMRSQETLKRLVEAEYVRPASPAPPPRPGYPRGSGWRQGIDRA
jgi:hypothetical protein